MRLVNKKKSRVGAGKSRKIKERGWLSWLGWLGRLGWLGWRGALSSKLRSSKLQTSRFEP